jgi:uncharacterized membrane protein required for colicin V production
MSSPDILDAVLVIGVIFALFSGYRRGISWVSFSLAGLLLGLLVGATLAPPIAKAIARHDPQTESILGTGVFLAAILLIQGIGTAIGFQIRKAALQTGSRLLVIDSTFGAALAGFGVLVSGWYLGIVFANTQFQPIGLQIQNSAILSRLDKIAPEPPGFLASIGQLLKGNNLPIVGILDQVLPPVQIPKNVDTPGIRAAQAVTVKVLAEGCALEAGTAWPVGTDHMVTNAHVVAGSKKVTVITPDGRTLMARVVFFDPEVDLAVLNVPGLGFHALTLADQNPSRDTIGAAIGYPEGGPEKVSPAAVSGVELARGRDIYGNQVVTRQIEVLAAQIIPGNSGGPMVDLQGNVIGLVFATSTVNPQEGYALTPDQISREVQQGVSLTAAASTSDCIS